MNPKLLFWVPALLRLGLLFAFAGLVWWWMGLVAGLSLALAVSVRLTDQEPPPPADTGTQMRRGSKSCQGFAPIPSNHSRGTRLFE